MRIYKIEVVQEGDCNLLFTISGDVYSQSFFLGEDVSDLCNYILNFHVEGIYLAEFTVSTHGEKLLPEESLIPGCAYEVEFTNLIETKKISENRIYDCILDDQLYFGGVDGIFTESGLLLASEETVFDVYTNSNYIIGNSDLDYTVIYDKNTQRVNYFAFNFVCFLDEERILFRDGVKLIEKNFQGEDFTSFGDYLGYITCQDKHLNKLLFGKNSGKIEIVNLEALETIKTYRDYASKVCVAKFNKTGNLVLSAGDDKVSIRDLREDKIITEFHDHTSTIYSVCFNSDETQILSTNAHSGVILWDTSTRKIIQDYPLFPGDGVSRAIFAGSDKKVVLTDIDGCVRKFDLA